MATVDTIGVTAARVGETAAGAAAVAALLGDLAAASVAVRHQAAAVEQERRQVLAAPRDDRSRENIQIYLLKSSLSDIYAINLIIVIT